jgi:hypothetical protein
MDVLVPNVVSLKDLLGLIMEIETFLKGKTSETGSSPIEVLSAYLSVDLSEHKGKVN